jgi:hypothetical protein
LIERGLLAEKPEEQLGETLLGALFLSEGVVHVLSNGDVPGRHAYPYEYVELKVLPELARRALLAPGPPTSGGVGPDDGQRWSILRA